MTEDTPSRGARYADRALLPEGLRDDLPPWAEYEATIVERLLATFAARGYERVAPPLIEFEESLLAGPGSAHSKRLFRLLDPESQRVMALRTDMTQQVARIAETRLSDRPRPLRLSYAGHVLRVKGSQLRPTRQFRQAGVELIGSGAREADLEIMALLDKAAVNYQLVLTKLDKLKAADRAPTVAAVTTAARPFVACHPQVLATSAEKRIGLEEVRATVAALAATPPLPLDGGGLGRG